MASFKIQKNNQDDLSWIILRHGPLCLYKNKNILNEALDWFDNKNYEIYSIECKTLEHFRNDISKALEWKENFGYEPWNDSFDALSDGFQELKVPDQTGTIFCFMNYSELTKNDPLSAKSILDVFSLNSREFLLYGKKLIGLIQSDEPFPQYGEIGGIEPFWNEKEWMNEDRTD